MAESPTDEEQEYMYERYVEEWLDDDDINDEWLEAIAFGEGKSFGQTEVTSDETAWNNIIQGKLPKPRGGLATRFDGKFAKGNIEQGTWDAWMANGFKWFNDKAGKKAREEFGKRELSSVQRSAKPIGREKAATVINRLEELQLRTSEAQREKSSLIASLQRQVGRILTSYTELLRNATSYERVAEIVGEARRELTGKNLTLFEERSRTKLEMLQE